MPSAVFLDRDGVLSRSVVVDGKGYAPRSLADFRLLPNAARSVARLHRAGFQVIVVTNQPDIGNGLVNDRVVAAMHDKLRSRTLVDEIVMCPHRQNAGCRCRKPNPGMLVDSAARRGLNLTTSFMVGDRASDVVAGQRAGCRTVFIDRRYAEAPPEGQTATVGSLVAAVNYILSLTPIYDDVA